MNNLVILYNPYYQSDVIEQHLAVLREKQKVAFGKVRSKIKAVMELVKMRCEELKERWFFDDV